MFKRNKRDQLEKNRRDGANAEEEFVKEEWMKGTEISRTGKGHDFKEVKRHRITGRVVESIYHEIKHGKSKLSKRQKEAKNRHGRRYVVHRYVSGLIGPTEVSQEHGRSKQRSFQFNVISNTKNIKNKSRQKVKNLYHSDPFAGLFGSPAPKRKTGRKSSRERSRNSDPFAGLFGSPAPKRKTGRKSSRERSRNSDPFAGLFGSPAPKRKTGRKSSRERSRNSDPFSMDDIFGSTSARKRNSSKSTRRRKNSTGFW